MEINCEKLKRSLLQLKSVHREENFLTKYVRLKEYTEKDVEKIITFLAQKLLAPEYTELIAQCFPDILLIVVILGIPVRDDGDSWEIYEKKCVALSKLTKLSPEIYRYAVKYFSRKPAPFKKSHNVVPTKKSKTENNSITDFDIVKCCFDLLSSDPAFYKDLWNWSVFVDLYFGKGSELQQLYYNYVVSILSSMTASQLQQLNRNISENVLLTFCNTSNKSPRIPSIDDDKFEKCKNSVVYWNFSSNVVTNIEGVLLPIYNNENANFYSKTDGNYDKIVKVDSTKVNLRSIALGISSGKAVCLSGPVGCGKTTLVEYLARKTGRIVPKKVEYTKFQVDGEKTVEDDSRKENSTCNQKGGKQKRKLCEKNGQEGGDFECNSLEPKNGFLRIQLGDQTDSKMLLGQYRCTDVPGEFIWLPGVLTQAVMNGYWLLLEDLDSATQDTSSILSSLLENNYLSVPGFRDCLKIEPGFQLFVTVRSQKSFNSSQKTTFSLLEKYLYTVNILPLSRTELSKIVSINYPRLGDIAKQIVDVFLKFSSGDHSTGESLRSTIVENNASEYTILPTGETGSISTQTNSGRLVSTRDLMKLCQRSYLMYSVTKPESAYFIFQNAVDVFCSYLPQGAEKTNLITSIGARLGINPSRCESFSKDYNPDVDVDNNGIKVGRAQLDIKGIANENPRKRGSDDDADSKMAIKKTKTDSNTENINCSLLKREKKITFSFTRLTCCLLERIAVCVNQNEPILLVGETGVGKTCSVQYLAAKTNHKLVVVNMNNQSDVSDLVGGFKPVDLSYVMAPVRYEFELLFRKTFNENKNEKFLSNISICYNRGDFSVLIKLMIRITDTVFKRAQNNDLKMENLKALLTDWKTLQLKLFKLNSQLNKSINISFAFITGSLVNCIKNGDWVLLDEINLASAETLECLSTILEPDGSIVLLEKGDLIPIKRHPEFRIFSCMNPNTDIGKKDLPIGIRNRFTEFFVDELTTEFDLRVLVGDYLSNTGIKNTKVLTIVKLYKKLKALSQVDLNDGLGNRPVFSLRTLCRSLTICAKNLCGSVERNLYESFCLSFLTQLDNDSHKVVLDLIKSAMLSDCKAVLSQQIPKPGEDYLNFEGYWIQKGPSDLMECAEYILTDNVRQNLKDLSRIISIGKLPILLQGPTSAGKTSLIEYVAKKSGNHCLRINNHEHTDLQEYIGTYTSDVTGKLVFKEGVLVQAMRNGFWIILDELNLASTDILEALNRVLDDNRELFIPETQVVVKAHPNFMLFATQNPPGLYGGRKTLSRAFKNRFIELHFSEIPKPELEIILEKRCLIPKSYSQKMVKCMSELQVNRKSTTKNNFTLRDLFRWGNRYTYADKKLLENNLYDWNQHLVDEGYLVLSAKVRTEIEVEIIEETLFHNFRKKINLTNLYSLHENTSLVTKEILESVFGHTLRSDIIWTQNMTRMAVLTAKALQFNEPVLLVGPTGCGKTTVCQILSNIKKINLRILNCHMHTEGADFLGGLRPCRKENEKDSNSSTQLFEWADGPLIHAMQDGSFFMADEISLAEDSVLERLNSVLEPSRIILLAEKGGVNSNIDSEALSAMSKDFIIQAADGFQFLATMNPGGDFGKKELSPALRNRFTEVWCKPSDAEEDLIKIAGNILKLGLENQAQINSNDVAKTMIKVVFYIKNQVDKFKFSVRDILAWATYLNVNSKNSLIQFEDSLLYGLEIIFLDSLEMLPHESEENIEKIKTAVVQFALSQMKSNLGISLSLNEIESKRGTTVSAENGNFGIKPFFIEMNPANSFSTDDFFFNAPTTKKNLFRLLSALSLNKAVLLEGPPGVGKTSIVENLAHAIGYKIVRINLCEHTDLADLFGTDLPAEEKALDIDLSHTDSMELKNLGSFVWRDGPLLVALKSENTWILLDELNLAPQSVLEGLNAILDHRGEVFIPELNKIFTLGKQTRIFACQNPLRQGGGRKGLPQSFLNRFTKVYLRKLNTADLLHVVNGKYHLLFDELEKYFGNFFKYLNIKNNKDSNFFEIANSKSGFTLLEDPHQLNIPFDLPQRMVKFSEVLDKAVTDMEFGYKGGPFEINLRDILRWCELLSNPKTGFSPPTETVKIGDTFKIFKQIFENFLLVVYERMKLVYYQRMRSVSDQLFIQKVFSEIFQCDAEKLNALSEDVGMYWTDSELYLNDIVLNRSGHDSDNDDGNKNTLTNSRNMKSDTILLSCQTELLKNVVECVHLEKPVIMSGPTDSGKTKVIDMLCSISNQYCDVETIEDSVTGSYQQVDLNRHLEEISQSIESIYTKIIQHLFLEVNNGTPSKKLHQQLVEILKLWTNYTNLSISSDDSQTTSAMSSELVLFRNRIQSLNSVIDKIKSLTTNSNQNDLQNLQTVLNALKNVVKNSETLNTGGHFEWVDSKIVKSLKHGRYICLEHVNLCSSAILDRLNPVFEPNGNLLLSEKGVTVGEASEIVHKHRNFRAFLTIDPKHGELSRAMRNRCVELDLTKNVYSEDDLRQIVFINGVTENYLIDVIVRIFHSIKDVTELNDFNISHLIHCAFLVAANKRIGLTDEKAVYLSGLEVYVYSATTDLLGYGLDFYQNKLREVVEEECKLIKASENVCDLNNVIIRTKDLSMMSMIRLQCEPLVGLLKCYPSVKKMKNALRTVFTNTKDVEIENGFKFIRYYIYLLYEICTSNDMSIRNKYVNGLLNSTNNLEFSEAQKQELIGFNNSLFAVVKTGQKIMQSYDSNLPWNTKLLPRIRKYNSNLTSESKNELRLSAHLLANLLLHNVVDEKITKLSKMSAIGYSQAIEAKKATDSFNNALLKQLSPFLKSLQTLLNSTLQYADMEIESYTDLAISNLWINRLYECSKNNLLVDKDLDADLIDKLLLHFKWLDKNFLKLLEQMLPNYKQLNQEFETTITKIRNYSLSVNHPLNLIRKIFFKQMICFVPYYADDQITVQSCENKIEEMTNLIPSFGSYDVSKLHRILRVVMSSESDAAKNLLANDILMALKYMSKVESVHMDVTAIVPQAVRLCITEYFRNLQSISPDGFQSSAELIELERKLQEIFNTNDEDHPIEPIVCGLNLQILPLQDYFATKALILSHLTMQQISLNEGYFETIPTYQCNSRKLFHVFNSKNYNQFKTMWQTVTTEISNTTNANHFDSLIAFLSSTHYRYFSTLDRVMLKMLQLHCLSTISARNDIFSAMRHKNDISADIQYNGPTLMNSLFSLLFQYDGTLKPIGLGELNEWRSTLNDMRQILWNNAIFVSDEYHIEKHHLNASLRHSQKLLLEVEQVQKQCHNLENQNFSDYNENFQKLTEKLKSTRQTALVVPTTTKSHPHYEIQRQSFYSALLNSLIGAVELCLFTFTPLIDPVEKNRLKNNYTNEDLQTLNSILTAYDFMKIVMRYKGLGSEAYNQFKSRITAIESKREKLAKKVALRPKICVYSKLVQDINHFLKMNSEPQAMLAIILDAENCMNFKQNFKNIEAHNEEVSTFLLKSIEVIKKLDLWIINSQRFLFDITKKYSIYYKDFTEPIECACVMVRTGFEGLKSVLTQYKDSFYKSSNGIFYNINEGGKICNTIKNISQYPSTHGLQIFDHHSGQSLAKTQSTIFTILDKMEGSEFLYFKLLKSKILEIKNHITIASMIEEHTFGELQTVYNICNQIWQDEEERRRKRQIEEESLYVNKTRCETENEEEIELQEIQKNFPTYVQQDFGEFIIEDTLEQVIKLKTDDVGKKSINLIEIEDYKLIAQNFIHIMEHFAKLYYYKGGNSKSSVESLDYITPFKTKISVFTKLVSNYKSCLNGLMDSTMYNTYGFIIGLQQDMLHDIKIYDDDSASYNFYKDSNIPEIISCTEVMDKIETRTKEQQALYPDHAVLIDILRVIQKIRSLPSTSSVVRFSTGFQILRQKVSQWNEVAHKNNHLRDLEEQVAEFIQKWTKLELQFWRNCLSYTFDGVQGNAYKYWFFIYNLLHEYLDKKETASNYTDYKRTEKHFEEDEIVTDGVGTTKPTVIRSADVISVLRQFVENSNYADFSVRLRLLRSFEFYLHYVETENAARKKNLIAILRNIQIYFGQFTQEIDDAIKAYRTPIEKKLREFVKIESYNKDLSYFSMRNNIARVHRNLNKFLKEYESLLKTKISSIFQQKENASQDYNLDNDKGINLRYEAKHKYYMIDVKNFLASQKLKNVLKDVALPEEASSQLLAKCDRLFTTSRNVVREAISNTQYSAMIHSLDCLLTDQIETCDYLRKLEVDRSQEKPKQKSQAKQILSQKRKGLSDLYKTLAKLGINYKTGLMELSMSSDFTDFKIQPFCVRTMFTLSKQKKLDQNLIYLNENLDLYFAKCVFKLKLLQNVMLSPNAELGGPNTDRMKGFSIDMYLLIQDQRKMLSKSIKELYDLRKKIVDITNLVECTASEIDAKDKFNFDELENKYCIMKTSLCEIRSIVEQFELLLKCLPDVENTNLTVLDGKFGGSSLVKSDPKYNEIMTKLSQIRSDVKKCLCDMTKNSDVEFLSVQKVQEVESTYKQIVESIEQVRNNLTGPNGEFLPAAQPLIDLLNHLGQINEIYSLKMSDDSKVENIDVELENIVHSVLLSLQKIYKKYTPVESTDEIQGNGTENKSPDKKSEPENPILDNHLKQNIHNGLTSDLEVLHISSVVTKLSNILLAVKYTGNSEEKANYAKKLASILPILEQFNLIGDYYLFQQLGAHKVATKMLSIMLTVFIELGTKGFCIPPDLMQDEEEGDPKKNDKGGGGFGMEDGTGENDVSDKIESEDQLDDAKRPEDRKDNDQKDDDCKEEKGIDMSEDFEGNMQDVDKNNEDDDSDKDDDEEVDKQMGQTEDGAEKLDDQIWGSDEENEQEEEENELSEEEEGKGTKDEEDSHNDLGKQNETQKGDDNEQKEDGLDAIDDNDKSSKEKKKQNDIDNMKDEGDDDQVNPYHNQLEEPPEPEEMDLGDCNLDEDNPKDGDDQQTENPFDIDKMKETMEVTDEMQDDEENPEEESKEDEKADKNGDDSDSEPEPEAGMKRDEDTPPEEIGEQQEQQTDDPSEVKDDVKDDVENPDEPEAQEKPEDKVEQDYTESKDKTSKEDNVQSVQEKEKKGSNDQVVNENDAQVEQDSNMDEQDTGEEKEGIGQAENDTSDRGHQGIADTKQTRTDQQKDDKKDAKEWKQQGNINEERTLGDADKNQIKQLKTIDKLKDDPADEQGDEDENPPMESDEYQHVREAKKTDSTTLDNATEEQSKQVQHLEDEEKEGDDENENVDELMETDEPPKDDEELQEVPDMQAEKTEQNSNKPSKSDKTKETCETTEKMEVEGDLTETYTVARDDSTTAHCIKDILTDTTPSQEPSTSEILDLRKMYQNDLTTKKPILVEREDYETWETISNKMMPNARELCEQLRLILEPTKCTRLKGDYRTGRRINMKKIIPYIASQFRKDKIWLRRTKPSQRDYKITIAIDDSKSMHHNNSKSLTLQAISLVSQALTLLESGKLSIMSFGESPHIILNHTEQFDGPKLVNGLEFAQNQSKIAELLDFVRTANVEEGFGSSNGIFENLLLVLSDGRNIFSEGEKKVKNAVKLARLQRIFLVYIIIDNPENKHSILDIRVPEFSADRKSITMKSYLDGFPFPYYVIVRDLGQLPIVLSEAMRQWFELVNSEQ